MSTEFLKGFIVGSAFFACIAIIAIPPLVVSHVVDLCIAKESTP